MLVYVISAHVLWEQRAPDSVLIATPAVVFWPPALEQVLTLLQGRGCNAGESYGAGTVLLSRDWETNAGKGAIKEVLRGPLP